MLLLPVPGSVCERRRAGFSVCEDKDSIFCRNCKIGFLRRSVPCPAVDRALFRQVSVLAAVVPFRIPVCACRLFERRLPGLCFGLRRGICPVRWGRFVPGWSRFLSAGFDFAHKSLFRMRDREQRGGFGRNLLTLLLATSGPEWCGPWFAPAWSVDSAIRWRCNGAGGLNKGIVVWVIRSVERAAAESGLTEVQEMFSCRSLRGEPVKNGDL